MYWIILYWSWLSLIILAHASLIVLWMEGFVARRSPCTSSRFCSVTSALSMAAFAFVSSCWSFSSPMPFRCSRVSGTCNQHTGFKGSLGQLAAVDSEVWHAAFPRHDTSFFCIVVASCGLSAVVITVRATTVYTLRHRYALQGLSACTSERLAEWTCLAPFPSYPPPPPPPPPPSLPPSQVGLAEISLHAHLHCPNGAERSSHVAQAVNAVRIPAQCLSNAACTGYAFSAVRG